jgi:hypothetical protein
MIRERSSAMTRGVLGAIRSSACSVYQLIGAGRISLVQAGLITGSARSLRSCLKYQMDGELIHRAAIALDHRRPTVQQRGHDLPQPLGADRRGDVRECTTSGKDTVSCLYSAGFAAANQPHRTQDRTWRSHSAPCRTRCTPVSAPPPATRNAFEALPVQHTINRVRPHPAPHRNSPSTATDPPEQAYVPMSPKHSTQSAPISGVPPRENTSHLGMIPVGRGYQKRQAMVRWHLDDEAVQVVNCREVLAVEHV